MKPGSWSLVFVAKMDKMVNIAVRVIAALVLLTLPLAAQAANRYWDGANTGGTGDGASAGGTATWDTSILNWDQGNGVSRVNWTNANNDTAIFAGTAGTVSLGTGITVGGLQFDTAAYTVQNNALTFGAAGSIVANQDATISSVITGSVAITKTGAGTLTLSGTNTYTGATIISNGTLKAGSSNALPAATTLSVTNTGIFDLNGYNATVTSVGAGSSTAMITNSAAGSTTNTLTITTFNTTFAPVIAEGAGQKIAVVVGGGQSTPWLANSNNTFSGGLTISSSSGQTRLWAGTMTTTTNGDGSIKSSQLGAGPVIIGTTTGGAQLGNFSANAQIWNPLVFNAASYIDGGNAAFRADATGIKLYGPLTANLSPVNFSSGGSGSVIALGQITGPNGLWLKTPATAITVTLSNITANANNYQGTTTLDAKTTLVLGGNEQIPNGGSAGNVTNNGTFNLGGFSETINGLSGTGTVDGVSGTPTLTVGDNDATGAANTFAGVIKNTTGTLSLVKTGSGALTLSGVNSYTGATTVSVGKLVGVTGGSCSGSAVTVASDATLGAKVLTSGGQWSCGALTLDSGTTTVEFDFTALPSTTVAPMLINGDLVNNGTLNVSIVNGTFFTGSTNPLIQYTGSLTVGTLGTASLPGGATGTLVNNTVNKTIDLSVTAGNLLLWSAGTGIWDINTSFNWNNQTATYTEGEQVQFDDTAAGAGPFTVTLTNDVNPGSVSVNNAAKAYTIGGSGAIAGAAALSKSGSGTLTLAGTNTYSGNTTVSAGTLILSGLLTNTAITVVSGATFTQSVSGVIAGSNSLNSSGTTTLAGANTYSGNTTVSAGTLILSGLLTNTAITVVSGATFTQSVSGVIAGSNSLNSSGATTLAGANTYTGATTVSAGTLKAGSTGGLSSNSAFTVVAGATLDLGGFNNTISRLSTNNNGGVITDSSAPGSGGTLRIATAMPATLNSNVFTGSLGLQFYGGSGNTILGNTSNTYSGGTTLGIGTGTTLTRPFISGTIGAGAPGAVTSGYFGKGPITFGASATDRAQFYFTGAATINNAIVVNSSQGDTAQFGAFRLEASGGSSPSREQSTPIWRTSCSKPTTAMARYGHRDRGDLRQLGPAGLGTKQRRAYPHPEQLGDRKQLCGQHDH